MMGRLLAVLFGLLATPAVAQVPPIAGNNGPSLTYIGPITSTHCAEWSVAGVLEDSGSACGGGGSAGITVGTSTITSGTSGRVLYDNAGVLGELAVTGTGNAVLATSPSVSGLTATGSFTATGLVTNADLANSSLTIGSTSVSLGGTAASISGLTLASPTISGTVAGAGTHPLSTLATETANTVVANVTAGSASPTAASLPSCVDTSGNHLNYTNGTGFSCGTSAAASGGMVLISTQTASGSADLRWTGLGSSYNVYLLTCTDVIPATTSQNLLTQLGEGGTPTWETSNYASVAGDMNSSNGLNSQTGSTGFIWNAIALVNNGDGVQGIQWIHGIASAVHKFVHGTSASSWDTSGNAAGNTMIGTYKGDTNVVTAIRVIMSSGNITSGSCSLYGLTP